MTRCATASRCGSPSRPAGCAPAPTCVAADAVSLLAAVVLYIFAIGVVKGFAFALGISTVIDLVVFFLFTKPMTTWLARVQVLLDRPQAVGLLGRAGRDRPHRRPPPSTEWVPDEPPRTSGPVALRRPRLDQLRRSQVALVRHLGRHRRSSRCSGSSSSSSTSASSSRAAWSTASPSPPGQADDDAVTAISEAVRRHRDQQRLVADRQHLRHRRRAHPGPDRAADHRGVRPVVDDAIRRRRGRARTSARRRSARPGASRSPTARCTGLVVFLVLVVLLIWAYFREWKMSVAAIVALAHDLIITVGVYALSGFEVTPATVTGILTILGLLALRHRGRLRQGPREHRSTSAAPTRPTPRRPTWRSTRRWCGRSTPRSWRCCRSARCSTSVSCTLGLGCAEGPRARAVRRHGRRRLLLDLHRHPAAGAAQGARAGRQGRATSGSGATAAVEPVDRFAEVPVFREDMPIVDDPDDPDAPPPGRRRGHARPGPTDDVGRQPSGASGRAEPRSPPGSAPARPVRCRTRRPPAGRSPAASPARGGASSEPTDERPRRPPADG